MFIESYHFNVVEKIIMKNIHIIGLGVAEKAVLSDLARTVILNADMVVGSERQLETVAELFSDNILLDKLLPDNLQPDNSRSNDLLPNNERRAERVLLPKLSKLQLLIEQNSDKKIVVLASGDPLYYGIGRWFTQHIASERLIFFPAVSSIQAACHECHLSLQDVDVISLHGRPLEKIRTKLHRNKTLVLLTDKNSHPHILAKECIAAGFGQSNLTVCENLGYAQQKVSRYSADELINHPTLSFNPLHVTIIEVVGEGGVLPEFPGIPDTNFITGAEPGKGMISKREVRLVILSLLQAGTDDVIWDVGAGCGGVSVELAYWNETARVFAVEHNAQRLDYLLKNCQRFGVTHNVNIISGRAPEALEALPKPNKIFIGGSDGELNTLLSQAWQELPVGGLLVASAVMASTKHQIKMFAGTVEHAVIESVELAVKRGNLLEGEMTYQSKLPVEIFQLKKCSPFNMELK